MPKKNTRPAASPTQPPVPPTGIQIPPAAHAVLALLDPLGGTTTADLAERAGLGRSTVTKALAALGEAGLAVRKPGGHDGARRIADLWFADALSATSPDRPEAADAAANGRSRGREQPDAVAAASEDAADAAPGADGPEPDPAGEREPTAQDATGGAAPDTDATGDPDQADAYQGSAGATASAEAAQEQSADNAVAAGSARLGKGELRDLVERHLREHPDRAWTPSAVAKELGRSAGAIKNACEKLVALGSAVTFEDAPSRFQYSGNR